MTSALDWDALVRLHSPRLRSVAKRYLRHPDAVEDAIQRVWLRAWVYAPRIRQEQFIGSWLYRIAINECLDTLRRRKAHGQPPSFEELPTDVVPPRHLAVEDAMNLRALVRADRDGALLYDFYVLGLTVPEAARRHGLPLGTVKTRMFRARQRLRTALEGIN